MSLTYGLKTPRDLFDKLRRDAELLNKRVTSDRFFNFVVTAYSLIDWIQNNQMVSKKAKGELKLFYSNRWFKVCGDIANASKHFKLNKRVPVTKKVESKRGFGLGRFGKGTFGEGEEQIDIELNDGSKIPLFQLVKEVLGLWDGFLKKHAL